MKGKFTFKTERATGRYGSFFPVQHYIKLKRNVVGRIDDKKPHKISLMVIKDDIMEDGNPNCDWVWKKVNREFNSVEEAKIWLNDNFERITTSLNLKQTD